MPHGVLQSMQRVHSVDSYRAVLKSLRGCWLTLVPGRGRGVARRGDHGMDDSATRLRRALEDLSAKLAAADAPAHFASELRAVALVVRHAPNILDAIKRESHAFASRLGPDGEFLKAIATFVAWTKTPQAIGARPKTMAEAEAIAVLREWRKPWESLAKSLRSATTERNTAINVIALHLDGWQRELIEAFNAWRVASLGDRPETPVMGLRRALDELRCDADGRSVVIGAVLLNLANRSPDAGILADVLANSDDLPDLPTLVPWLRRFAVWLLKRLDALEATASTDDVQAQAKPRGRRRKQHPHDEQIVSFWRSGRYRTKKELAEALGLTLKLVAAAIERSRKRAPRKN